MPQDMVSCDWWDHPRACGEHDTPLHTPLNVIGSSPRMRGTPAQHRALLDESRIIPAHAGNTSRGSCAWYPRRDHPRACGEHVVERRSRRGFKGSSPRMRGTRIIAVVGYADLRIIPAHAGNTWRARIGLPPNGDHPRACGEHWPTISAWPSTRGSSPRMRGTPHGAHGERLQLGIIPAHAGNTCSRVADWRWKRDHPRACGEHLFESCWGIRFVGSSPRMRGTH